MDADDQADGRTWRVSVDAGRCVGSGVCAAAAPGHFRVVQGTSRPRAALIEPDEAAVGAADLCPVEAIAIRTASSGDLISPRA
jgi:ferredoxin